MRPSLPRRYPPHAGDWQTPLMASPFGTYVAQCCPAVSCCNHCLISRPATGVAIIAVRHRFGFMVRQFTSGGLPPQSYSADGTYLVPTWSLPGGWAYLPGSLPGTHLAPTWYLGAYLDPGVTARLDI